MNWNAYFLSFRVATPVHPGSNVIGNVLRAAPFVTGKSLWGAVTATLTRLACHPARAGDYERVGEIVRNQLRFGYFFPAAEGATYIPTAAAGRVRFADPAGGAGLSADEFEHNFLDSWVATAIDPAQGSASNASLHELEILRTHTRDGGHPISLAGHIFVRPGGNVTCEDGRVVCFGIDLATVLGDIQIGGDRTYGFGRIQLDGGLMPVSDLFGCPLDFGGEPVVTVEKGGRAFADVSSGEFTAAVAPPLRGRVHPVVGREWREGKGSGATPSPAAVCWAPGSEIVGQSRSFVVGPYGRWSLLSAPPASGPSPRRHENATQP